MGWVDLQAGDAPQQIRARAAHPRLKGLRPMLQDLAATEWILQQGAHQALVTMAECDLVFDALIQPRHLPIMAELVRRHPTLRVVIDHGAKPLMSASPQAMQHWRSGLQQLGRANPGRSPHVQALWPVDRSAKAVILANTCAPGRRRCSTSGGPSG